MLLPKVNRFLFDMLHMFYTVPQFFLWTLSLSVIYVIFIIFLQITELQKDQVKVATATIEDVLANPDKETTKLIKAAQEDYESEYVSCTQVWGIYKYYWCVPKYVFWVHFNWTPILSC